MKEGYFMTFLEELKQQKEDLISKECSDIAKIMDDQIKGFKDYLKEYNNQNLFDNLSYLAITATTLEDLKQECVYYGELETVDTVYSYCVKTQKYIFYTILAFLQKKGYSIGDVFVDKQQFIAEIVNLLHQSIIDS